MGSNTATKALSLYCRVTVALLMVLGCGAERVPGDGVRVGLITPGSIGVIGFVGGIELPPIVLGYQGWVNGAAAVRRNIDTRISYLNNFDDATAGHEAALALIRLGVDMLHHNAAAAGLGVFQAVKESPGVLIFGANADQSCLAPDRVIGSAVIDLPRAFLLVARDVAAGTFVPQVQSFGLASGVISYRPNPAATRALFPGLGEWMDAVRDSIITGTLSPLTAPAGDAP